MAEHESHDLKVAGSSPVLGTSIQWVKVFRGKFDGRLSPYIVSLAYFQNTRCAFRMKYQSRGGLEFGTSPVS